MELTEKLLSELQKRLKIGNRRGVHLNAIPGNSSYKFDLNRLAHIKKNLPNEFIESLMTVQSLRFKISWKDNVPDLNSLFIEDQTQLVRITKAFENLINQTEAIESEKGINTFGFGFPILIRRDQADNKLTVAPVLIWSLRIKRTKEFNTWEILRNEDDPIYLNEVLSNHLENDSKIRVESIPNEMLDDGIISKDELIEICINLIKSINTTVQEDIDQSYRKGISNITSIKDKSHYEKISSESAHTFIEFCGLFSIFEVQKQNIINDYDNLLKNKDLEINLGSLDNHHFQSISSIETDPSQQGILHSLETSRNILIQGPPGTGKSQTLTAILINALENHKKTIVVCEKRTALEVLHNALIERGLNNHIVLIRDIVKDRKNVVDSVRERVNRYKPEQIGIKNSKDSLYNLIGRAEELIKLINARHRKLDERLIGDKSWTDTVGIYLSELRVLKGGIKIDKFKFNYTQQELNYFLGLIERGEKIYSKYRDYENLSFLNSTKLVGNNPFIIENSINESFARYSNLYNEIVRLEKKYLVEYRDSRKSEFESEIGQFEEIYNSINAIIEKNRGNLDFQDEQKTSRLVYRLSSIISKKRKEIILDQNIIRNLFYSLKIHFESSKNLTSIRLEGKLSSDITNIQEVKNLIYRTKVDFDTNIQRDYDRINFLKIDLNIYAGATFIKIQNKANELIRLIRQESWINSFTCETFGCLINELPKILEIKDRYFDNENDIFSREFEWFQFYNSLNNGDKELIDELKSNENWRQSFMVPYLNSLLLQVANYDLPTSDSEHIQLSQTLNVIKDEQLSYIRACWKSQQIDSIQDFERKNKTLTVENLYNKRISHRFKRLSLRKIVQYDPK